jgi:hypothetical protein
MRVLRKTTAVIAGLALALSLPATGMADRGGVPHSTKPCKTNSHAKGPKKSPKNSRGKKCGFRH